MKTLTLHMLKTLHKRLNRHNVGLIITNKYLERMPLLLNSVHLTYISVLAFFWYVVVFVFWGLFSVDSGF